MLNIRDLEKRWKIYKIKSFLPYFIVSIVVFAIVPAVYYFYTANSKAVSQKKPVTAKKTVQKSILPPKNQPAAVKVKPVKKQPAPMAVQPKPVTAQPKTVVADKTKETSFQTLKPSMNFMKNIQHEVRQPQYRYKQTKHKHFKERKVTEAVQDISVKSPSIKKEKKISITIQRKETQNDIFEIIKRFKKNKNPALSLFVAKKYYELGNYKQAYNYALITNQINSNIEASWIVFAKSLMQLHQKNKAIHTLQEYIKVSHSSNAEILLNEIKSGKFR
ncbi:CDC27 family protein [Sulfurimonas sp. NWX367]|uniref:CDC27 family protein n=1 Tax=Sulfurimonas sp. NWX367 TaxID=2925413 RepID=UPI003204E55A